jgi:hypothetical protein
MMGGFCDVWILPKRDTGNEVPPEKSSRSATMAFHKHSNMITLDPVAFFIRLALIVLFEKTKIARGNRVCVKAGKGFSGGLDQRRRLLIREDLEAKVGLARYQDENQKFSFLNSTGERRERR